MRVVWYVQIRRSGQKDKTTVLQPNKLSKITRNTQHKYLINNVICWPITEIDRDRK